MVIVPLAIAKPLPQGLKHVFDRNQCSLVKTRLRIRARYYPKEDLCLIGNLFPFYRQQHYWSRAQPGQPGIMSGGSGLNKQEVGTVAGAIGGGVLGSTMGKGTGKTAMTIGGALLGGWLGSSVGHSLDNADMAAYNSTTQRAMETAQPGQTLPWSNPQSGNSGTITPQNYYQSANGQYCREYSQTITVGGKRQQAYGKACRQPDSTWQVME